MATRKWSEFVGDDLNKAYSGDAAMAHGKFPLDNLVQSLATVFSASTAYSAGDVVMYQGKLWRFTADHPAGAWTGSDASLVNLFNLLAQKTEGVAFCYTRGSSAIPNIDTATNTIDFGGDFIIRSHSRYAVISSRNVSICDTSISTSAQVLWYNFITGNFEISHFNFNGRKNDSVIVGFIRFNDNSDFGFFKAWFPFDFTIDGVSDATRIANLEDILGNFKTAASLADADETKQGYIKYVNGTFVETANLKTAVFKNQGYKTITAVTGATDAIPATIAFYSGDFGKGYLRGASVQGVAGNNITYTASVPPEAKTIAFSYRESSYYSPGLMASLFLNFGTYTSMQSAGHCMVTKGIDESYLAWYRPATQNRIFSVDILAKEGDSLTASLPSDSTYNFALHIHDSSGTKIYDSGWNLSLSKTFPANTAYIILWWRKTDDSVFTAGDEDVPNTQFTSFALTTDGYGTALASVELVEQKVSGFEAGLVKNRVTASKILKNVAHQGYSLTSNYYGNNRLSSYTKLAEYGFDFGEVDIQFSSDGVPVCCHDATFTDQDTSEVIIIADHTAAELKTYNYYGETIATLEEVIAECKNQGCGVYLDKVGGFISDATKLSAVTSLLMKYSMEDHAVWLIGASQTNVDYIHNWYADAPVTFLVYTAVTASDITLANSVRNASRGYVGIDFDCSTMTVDEIIAAKASLSPGVSLETWTIDSATIYANYAPYVSRITSNKLSKYLLS